MHRPALRNRPARRRGIVIVLTAAILSVLFLCATLAVDLGHIHAVAAEMQNTGDAAALAGAGLLKEELPEYAYDVALDIIARNQKPQGFSSLADQVIELGTWNSVTRTFTTLAESGATKAFAVRVVSHRTETPYFFAAIMGKHSADVYREAVAAGNGPCNGIWGLEGVTIPGNVRTDSYDSTAGAYSVVTAGEEGDVCSGRGINGMGSIEIWGDMMTGLGYWPDLAGTAGLFSSGITTSAIDGMVGPVVELPAGTVNDGSLVLTGLDNLTLAPGTYYYDSIRITGTASLTVTGPTTIYVDGSIDAGGVGFVNTTGDPNNLEIIALGTDTGPGPGLLVDIGGTADFFGSILAPDVELRLRGTSDFYGGAIGKTVTMLGDFQFHVDESLPINDMFEPPPPTLVR